METRRDSGTHVAKHRPDAIVCSNDIAADTLLKTLKKLAAATTPFLTTIHQPCFDLATTAFQALFDRIENQGLPTREILLDAPLVVRKLTKRRI